MLNNFRSNNDGIDGRDNAQYAVIDVDCRVAIDRCGCITLLSISWKRSNMPGYVVSCTKQEVTKGPLEIPKVSK